jgi:hypothetical protein
MRLATGRDELEPLRDPLVQGPEDPRLTMLVLARVVQRLGSVEYVTVNEIEGMFAADLAYLQDFYAVINFGDQQEYEALLRSAGRGRPDLVVPPERSPGPAGPDTLAPGPGLAPGAPTQPAPVPARVSVDLPTAEFAHLAGEPPQYAATDDDIPTPISTSRRAAIQEVATGARS